MIVWWLIHWQNCYRNLWIQNPVGTLLRCTLFCLFNYASLFAQFSAHYFNLLYSCILKIKAMFWKPNGFLTIRLRERFLILFIMHAKLHGSIAKFHERVCIPSSKFHIHSSFGEQTTFLHCQCGLGLGNSTSLRKSFNFCWLVVFN